jgi:hypothetical protein
MIFEGFHAEAAAVMRRRGCKNPLRWLLCDHTLRSLREILQ